MKSTFLPVLVLGALTTSALAQDTTTTVPAPVPATEGVVLRLNLAQGQTFNMRITSRQKLSETIQGKRMDINSSILIGMAMTVKAVAADGTIDMETRYTSMAMNTAGEMGGQKFSTKFDSTHPEQKGNPQARMLSSLVGQSLVMKMKPTGQVTEIKGFDQMWKNIIAKMEIPKGVDRATYMKSMDSMKDQFGDKSLRNLANSFALYPSKPLNIGDSWSNNATMNMGFPMSTQTKYTLKSTEDGRANIGFHSVFKIGSGPKTTGPGINPKISMSGDQTGTLIVDQATGWTRSSESTLRFSGNISMPDPAHTGKTMSWPMYMKGTTTIETLPGTSDEIKISG